MPGSATLSPMEAQMAEFSTTSGIPVEESKAPPVDAPEQPATEPIEEPVAEATAPEAATEEPAADAPETPETPAADAPALPEWSKPLQQVQQENANLRKTVEATNTKLDTILEKLAANPTPANKAASVEVQAEKDRLAEIEAQIADPNFDAFEKNKDVLSALVEEVKTIRTENRAMKKERQEREQAAGKHEQFWGDWAKANPELTRTAGETLWQQAAAEADADATLNHAEKLGAAKLLFRQKVAAEKAKPAAAPTTIKPPTTPPPPVTSSGGRLTPKAPEVKPVPQPRTLEQKVRAGEFGLADELL